ncbi:S-methyl-5'-thioadenosine phosphorylase [Alicyclobacillus sp.]|uniref:S-methyl-5'-thioadenosine phosphorylase n=1 Tax=Alicyclobacillus sp. TaxID=61169 RepID=UPI0025BF2960|nr:S-methyl-5'-thioadenosine phosphorylase [Alicyclobacillus sp.]MCL6515522.1 S-methyl-5'-thioadenosine phosphorylase [Alicyclobacillus sp.]
MHADYAIIGGTGVYDPALLESPTTERIETPYGPAEVTLGRYQGKAVAFMPRHGSGHSIPPHRINYRANIAALKQLGVTQVLATAAVGSLQTRYEPGSLVLIDGFLDFTKSRPTTFFEDGPVVHVDMTDPYCGRLRREILAAAGRLGLSVHDGGTYVCAEGPRFETPQEIRLYQSWGAAVVGMTSVPEVVLAKEAELCYATVCMVTNYGAGISPTPLTHEEVVEEMAKNVHRIRTLFFDTIAHLDGTRDCRCPHAVGGQKPLLGMKEGKTP